MENPRTQNETPDDPRIIPKGDEGKSAYGRRNSRADTPLQSIHRPTV
jgi:hypothetical protein